jgi:hypothetical protein
MTSLQANPSSMISSGNYGFTNTLQLRDQKLNAVDSEINALTNLAMDPNVTPVARGQALAQLDLVFGEMKIAFNPRLDLAPAQGGAIALARAPTVTFRDFDFGGIFGQWTSKAKEIINPATWHAETTNTGDKPWANMKYPISVINKKTGKAETILSDFASNGCHATALINAMNVATGSKVSPRNVRDFLVKFSSLPPSEQKGGNTQQIFMDARKKVDFIDIAGPGGPKIIDRHKLFDTPSSNRILDDNLRAKIMKNVLAGNPVVIGLAEGPSGSKQVRHSAVATGVVRIDGKDHILVRDNWQTENGEAKLMTLDEFFQSYGQSRNTKNIKLDYVWAARANGN